MRGDATSQALATFFFFFFFNQLMKGKDQFFAFKPKILDFIDSFAIKCDSPSTLSNHFRTLVDYTTDGGNAIVVYLRFMDFFLLLAMIRIQKKQNQDMH